MAEIKYRETTVATIPSTTSAKGTPLTNMEMDGNMRSIQMDLLSKASASSVTASIQSVSDSIIAMSIALG
jgi:hypothetical protein